ncbi:hypothetical protein H6F76_04645 [Leptolyngbya sp. FACHB-321]|uniref:hypothetical protein n=1 Tax=Leptolyngbya sp. FACHB-321 TaxID=2692807 RepID=UPI0016830CBA|nr:hypothetical protein [Leptolyngbya sp. FACHB-321]MBD2034324.1 hypothetical protein [Leptolyngbya sp. FACHB-321]
MKRFKLALIALVMLINFVVVQPSWADPVKLTETPDYTDVTQAIDKLLKIKQDPNQTAWKPAALEQQLGELNLQKYILESATEWGQCRNETGKTLAVYAHKGKKADQPNTLYYLGNGQVTDDDFSCDGVYLPTGAKVDGFGTTEAPALTAPLAFKVVGGTQLVAKANPDTDTIAFNVKPAKVFKVGEGTWSIPDLTQADVEAAKPNAPIED